MKEWHGTWDERLRRGDITVRDCSFVTVNDLYGTGMPPWQINAIPPAWAGEVVTLTLEPR